MPYEEQNDAGNAWSRTPADRRLRSAYRGCLVGGAVGDALGAPVEFMYVSDIHRRFGTAGIRDYVPAYGRIGAITDDTQMTLYTAEGLLRAHVRSALQGIPRADAAVTAHAYLRWLATQGVRSLLLCDDQPDGWLSTHRDLYHRRAPGNTCLSALRHMQAFGNVANNDSKGCGGVMRAAPVGLFVAHDFAHADDAAVVREAFRIGCEIAALTHGHPTGFMAAGVLAAMIAMLVAGASLDAALDAACSELWRHPGHEETMIALRRARSLAQRCPRDPHVLPLMGEGWVAEEALAIGVYCALCAHDFDSALILSVNHSGDSDSTGSITGNLLGAITGIDAIAPRWRERLELLDVIEAVADDLATVKTWHISAGDQSDETAFYCDRYPGH